MKEVTLSQQLASHVRNLRRIEMIRPLLAGLASDSEESINLMLDQDENHELEQIKMKCTIINRSKV